MEQHVPVGTPVVAAPPQYPGIETPKYPGVQPKEADAHLQSLGVPSGVAEELKASVQSFPLRIFVVDNSGSMSTPDGHRLHQNRNGSQTFVNCTRWAELAESLRWHATLAARLGARTEFRLLNPPGNGAPQVVVTGLGEPDAEIAAMDRVLSSGPTGRTPLCEQVREVVREVEAMAPALRASGRRVCLVIASDGAATDGDIQAAMRPLQRLPVWVVVRLCTDDAGVVDYWNGVDEDLELDMDVLDDHAGEAAEVCRLNPWLTYGLALHRLREFGCMSKVLDLLDERRLNASEALAVIRLVLGSAAAELPEPQLDWVHFEATVAALLAREADVWDPLRLAGRPWFSVNKLRRHYGQRNLGHVLRDAVLDTKHALAGDPTKPEEGGCVLQ